jgi:hypothetical protein
MSNFWSQAATEPKRKFRWLLYFGGMPQFIAKTVTKPSFNVGASQHQFLQHKFNYPGRVEWQPITMTLVDPVNPDATQSLYNILGASGYVLPTDVNGGPSGMETISKEKMVAALGNRIQIDQIGPDGASQIIESWIINNPIITSVNFDSLDYGTDEMLNISIGVSYDWATLNEDPSVNPTVWTNSTSGPDNVNLG